MIFPIVRSSVRDLGPDGKSLLRKSGAGVENAPASYRLNGSKSRDIPILSLRYPISRVPPDVGLAPSAAWSSPPFHPFSP